MGLRSPRQGLRHTSVSTTACGYPDLLARLYSVFHRTFMRLRTRRNIFSYLFHFVSLIENPYIHLRSLTAALLIRVFHLLLLIVIAYLVVSRTNLFLYEQWTTARSRRVSLHTTLSRLYTFMSTPKTFLLVSFQYRILLS